jgi:predicted small lipoprotein YifL
MRPGACAVAAALALALLAACGADGPPIAPAKAAAAPTGLAISGEASFGLARDGAK